MKKNNFILGYIFVLLLAISGCSSDEEKLEVRKITVEPDAIEVAVGGTTVIVPTALPDRITDAVFEWSSESEAIATVDQTGEVTGVKVGTTNIIVKSGTISKSIPVKVYKALNNIILSPDVTSLNLKIRFGVAESKQINATPDPIDFEGGIVWKSTNEDVVTVSSSGLITAIGEGAATISVMGGDGAAKKDISITVEREGDDAIQFDSKLFKRAILPNDYYLDRNEWWYIESIWDGVGDQSSAGGSKCGTGEIQSFTFDMGVTGQLAYFHLFTWESKDEGYPPFFESNLKKFEIWGSENWDNSGDWGSWTKLMDCDVTKPSGLPLGEYNAEDWSACKNGQKFYNSDNYDAKVRYIRVRVLETWGGSDCWRIEEIRLYGTPE